jgi:hypothetical protein
MKNGDFPGVLYAYDQSGAIRTNSDLIDGTLQSLGGKFQAHATIAKRFIDIPSGQTLGAYPGAATVRNKGATVGGGQDFIYNTFMLNRLAQLGTQTQVRVNGAISGSARVGATLTVSAITWIGGTPDVIEYQWAWGPANSPTAIVGATSASYTPVTGDIGHTIVRGVRGQLTGEDFGDWAYTAATATVAAASNMPVPQSSGTAVSATAANAQVNVTAPASLADGDLEHLIIRTANQPISTPSGWSSRASVGTGTAAAVGSVALQLFERVANVTGGDSADVVITGTYDNLSARRLRYTGQGASSPTTDVQTKIVSTASTSVSSPTGTTPQANCLARAYIGYGLDATSAGATLANSSLANVSTTGNWGTTVGVGGVTNTAVGEKAAAGAVSAWTATCTSAKQVHIVCVIQP